MGGSIYTCVGQEINGRSNVSRLLILGWTQEVPDFAEAVQPVQGVQPKIQINRNTLRKKQRPLLHCAAGRATYNKDLPKWVDRLDRLDGANKDGHFSRPSSDRDLAAPGRRSCLPALRTLRCHHLRLLPGPIQRRRVRLL